MTAKWYKFKAESDAESDTESDTESDAKNVTATELQFCIFSKDLEKRKAIRWITKRYSRTMLGMEPCVICRERNMSSVSLKEPEEFITMGPICSYHGIDVAYGEKYILDYCSICTKCDDHDKCTFCKSYDHEGYDSDGYDIDGYDKNGFNCNESYYENGFDSEGYDENGFDSEGVKHEGNI